MNKYNNKNKINNNYSKQMTTNNSNNKIKNRMNRLSTKTL